MLTVRNRNRNRNRNPICAAASYAAAPGRRGLGSGRVWSLVSLLSVAIACGDEVTRVQLVLTPDPELAPKTEVAAQVGFIRVVVDSADGLLGVEHAGVRTQQGIAIDWDDDGALEVLFDVTLSSTELRALEIGLTQNADRELTYRVLGYASAMDPDRGIDAIALGGITASCPTGEECKLGTPFNLRADARRPKVVLVLPPDGATQVPANLAAVTVMFSTTLDATTLDSRARLVGPGGTIATTSTLEALVYATADGSEERRSLLTLGFHDPLDNGDHWIEIDTGVLSQGGRRFDQNPTTSAEDGFVSRFFYQQESGGGLGCDGCPPGYACAPDGTNHCMPVIDCSLGCLAGSVCDTSRGACIDDCRSFGLCVDPMLDCNESSGLCQ